MRHGRLMLWVFGCSLGLTVVLGPILVFTLPGLFGEMLWGKMWLFNGHVLVAAVCVHAFEHGRARPLMVAAMIALVFSFLAWTGWIWLMDAYLWVEEFAPAIATPFTAFSAFAGIVALLRAMYLSGLAIWLRRAIYVLAGLAAMHVSLATAAFPFLRFSGQWATEQYIMLHIRASAAFIILIGCGALACAAAFYLRKMHAGGEPLVPRIPVNLTCPRCGLSQQLQTEGDACARCRLRIKVAIP